MPNCVRGYLPDPMIGCLPFLSAYLDPELWLDIIISLTMLSKRGKINSLWIFPVITAIDFETNTLATRTSWYGP